MIAAGIGLGVSSLSALKGEAYSPAAYQGLQASGTPFLIDFYATWCSTCRAQERVIDELRAENPAYAAIPILRVDWDQHGNGQLVRELGIPRRSTLVIMKGGDELGRLVAQTGKGKITELLDLAI
jgi:thiol:disulfide interchange protein